MGVTGSVEGIEPVEWRTAEHNSASADVTIYQNNDNIAFNVLDKTASPNVLKSVAVGKDGVVHARSAEQTYSFKDGVNSTVASNAVEREKLDPKLAAEIRKAAEGFLKDGVVDANEAKSIAGIIDQAQQVLPVTWRENDSARSQRR